MSQKLSLNSQNESSDDDSLTPSDDAVRQALLRMGSGSGHNGGASRRGGEQASAPSASPDARRRRFSQNEHVPVEYVSRDRSTPRHEPTDGGDDRLASLGRELEREKQARETAERGLAETRLALQHAQTRLAHLEIDLAEARAQRQVLLAHAPVSAPSEEAAPVPDAEMDIEPVDAEEPVPVKRGRGRPRLSLARRPAEPEEEPEPVKWWVGD